MYAHRPDSFMCEQCSEWYHVGCVADDFLKYKLNVENVNPRELSDQFLCCVCRQDKDMLEMFAEGLAKRRAKASQQQATAGPAAASNISLCRLLISSSSSSEEESSPEINYKRSGSKGSRKFMFEFDDEDNSMSISFSSCSEESDDTESRKEKTSTYSKTKNTNNKKSSPDSSSSLTNANKLIQRPSSIQTNKLKSRDWTSKGTLDHLFEKSTAATVAAAQPAKTINEKLQNVRDKIKEPNHTKLIENSRNLQAKSRLSISNSNSLNSLSSGLNSTKSLMLVKGGLANTNSSSRTPLVANAKKPTVSPPTKSQTGPAATTTSGSLNKTPPPQPNKPAVNLNSFRRPIPPQQQQDPRKVNSQSIYERLRQRQMNILEDPTYTVLSEEQLEVLAQQIEENMCTAYGEVNNPKSMYHSKMRTIKQAISDSANTTFYRKLLTGQIRAHELPQIRAEDMSDDRVREEKRRQQALELKNIVEHSRQINEDKAKFLYTRNQQNKIDESDLNLIKQIKSSTFSTNEAIAASKRASDATNVAVVGQQSSSLSSSECPLNTIHFPEAASSVSENPGQDTAVTSSNKGTCYNN